MRLGEERWQYILKHTFPCKCGKTIQIFPNEEFQMKKCGKCGNKVYSKIYFEMKLKKAMNSQKGNRDGTSK